MTAKVPVRERRCVSCDTAFTSLEAMAEHFASEFHLNNVRLRVDGKPPLTLQEYKRSANRNSADPNSADADATAPQFSCTLCNKTFRSIQTLQSHVKSTAHLMKKEQRIIARDSEAGSMLTSTSLGSAAIGLHRRHKTHSKFRDPNSGDGATGDSKAFIERPKAEDREEDVDEKRCLFCGLPSNTMEMNLQHMVARHEFQIPLPHRCKDSKTLLLYLARKINGLVCLVCNEKTSRSIQSLEALRNHMHEMGHDRLLLGPEYQEFYHGTLVDLDDPSWNHNSTTEAALLQLSEKRGIVPRDQQMFSHRKKESIEQAENRRSIMAATNEANEVIRRERMEELRPAIKQQQETNRRAQQHFQRAQLHLSVRANKLHPKGYDGEGEIY